MPGECAPVGGSDPTGATYDTVDPDGNGGFTVTFTGVDLAKNGTATITYQARMRETFSNGDPTAGGDSFTQHRRPERHHDPDPAHRRR